MPPGIYEHRRRPLADRFWEKVDKNAGPAGCWPWLAYLSPTGYGRLGVGGRRGQIAVAHRIAWELTTGPIPEGLEIDHLCHNRGCQNPAHMELVTRSENLRRQVNPLRPLTAALAAKTHCPQGHLYDEANTLVKKGSRYCRACARLYTRRRYYEKRGRPIPELRRR